MYCNVTTHKKNHPLRPIISQVTTPTYRIAKQLNKLISPYIPTKFSIRSTNDFIDIIRSTHPEGLLTSLDVESLFTNVPVDDTIKIILDNVYNHANLPPLKIPRNTLEALLRACTTEAPFRSPDGMLYRQINGVSMGSPLGPTFADFYMCQLENKVLENSDLCPTTYCRYVDDIFMVVRHELHLQQLKNEMENQSVLKFTYELSVNNKIPFLDILISNDNGILKTTVYRKATNVGKCLNAVSECPQRYQLSVVRSHLSRAYKNCSSWDLIHLEIQRCKQILINNGYSNHLLDKEIHKFLSNIFSQTQEQTNQNTINIYYRNQMTPAHLTDERVLHDIVTRNVTTNNPQDKLNLIIYYKNTKVSNLIMKNNTTKKLNKLQKTNVVYDFTCPHEGCTLRKSNYIGMTTTSLSRRLTMHLQTGSIKDHMLHTHKSTLTRKQLEDNTTIIKHCPDFTRLQIIESLYIRERGPSINNQTTGQDRVLTLFNQTRTKTPSTTRLTALRPSPQHTSGNPNTTRVHIYHLSSGTQSRQRQLSANTHPPQVT